MNDHFADFDEETTSSAYSPAYSASSSSSDDHSTEVFSRKISAKYRTFFVDVKENSHGYLLKISEKSRGGKKSTIMFDAEDLDGIIDALQEAKKIIS